MKNHCYTGEPCAVKVASTLLWRAVGKGLVRDVLGRSEHQNSTSLAAYPAYIQKCSGNPLMPRKACLLLKQGNANVVRMVPFTLQLLYSSSGHTQAVSSGIDTGTRHIGVSATTEHSVLLEAEVRQDSQELLATRQQFRRAPCGRKARYRTVRFQNRKKPQGWLAPSVRHKVDAHLNAIKQAHQLLPIKQITMEVAQFEIQKIQHPDIAGTGYQQGPQMDCWNGREYVLFRDGHLCQWCRGKSRDGILNVHHIERRKTGGDRPDNLIMLCKTCHDLIYRTHQEHTLVPPSKGFRDATQMGIIRWFIYNEVRAAHPQVHVTYGGYLTKHTRITHRVEKSHKVDARCIGGHPKVSCDGSLYILKRVRPGNRQLHKATIRKGSKRQRNTAPKEVYGFPLFDCVRYQGQICFVWGRRSTAYFDLRTLNGTKIYASANRKKLTDVQKASTCLIERRCGRIPTAEPVGILPQES